MIMKCEGESSSSALFLEQIKHKRKIDKQNNNSARAYVQRDFFCRFPIPQDRTGACEGNTRGER